MPPPMPDRLIRGSLVLAILATAAVADEPPCPPLPPSETIKHRSPAKTPFIKKPSSKTPSTKPPTEKAPSTEGLPTYVTADEVRSIKDGLSEFLGNVELKRGEERISADRIVYDKPTDTAEASGSVRIDSATGDHYETESLWMQIDPHIGHTAECRFRTDLGNGRGDATRIEFAGPDRTFLSDARYTTCPAPQDDWFLNARELELDNAEEIGTARHAWIEFKDVPIFYFPYMNFPITDKRKSGFLFPSFGYDDNHGLILAAPYYFNLAPNYDATLTPQILGKRGLMLQGEFRYLTRASHGQLAVEALPNDKETNEDRHAISIFHRQTLNRYWTDRVEFRRVSDENYFRDFGDNIGIRSQTHLPQIAELAYRGAAWNFTAKAADYQTIDPDIAPTSRPYARLPQLTLATNPTSPVNTPRLHLEADWVHFDRDASVTGSRTSVTPAVSLPMMASWGFLTPRISARRTAYSLDNVTDDPPSLTTTTASLDGGLIFERDAAWGERALTQTLEPRLFYLRTAHKDQDTLPVFDTALADFSFASLFRENRFSGGDRVGDANQLTAAVTTRFLDNADGAERLRLSVGQIRYFEDRLVNLPPGTANRETSDFAAEAIAWLAGNWHARAAWQWNPDAERSEKRSYYAQYQPAPNKILTFGYQFIRDQADQADIATEWPLSIYWTLHARSLYSLREDRNMESYVGAEYGTCCWAFRVFVKRRFAEERDESGNVIGGRQDNSIQFQLELTGLSKLGTAPTTPLRQGLFYPWRDRDADSSPY